MIIYLIGTKIMDDDKEEKFMEAHAIIFETIVDLFEQGVSPAEVAGILQASATRIYRGILSEEEYVALMKTVIETGVDGIDKKREVVLH